MDITVIIAVTDFSNSIVGPGNLCLKLLRFRIQNRENMAIKKNYAMPVSDRDMVSIIF
jgi:hypothetical protein